MTKTYTHENGYSATLYGRSQMCVYYNGREILHSYSRKCNTKKEVMKMLGEMPDFLDSLDIAR